MMDSLRSQDKCKCTVVADVDWRVAIDTVVRPDLSILCEAPDGDFINSPPTMIAEVLSPSTAAKDRDAKRKLYQTQGVPWYLMVDLDAKSCELLELRGGDYYQAEVESDQIELLLHDGCFVRLDFSKLFP